MTLNYVDYIVIAVFFAVLFAIPALAAMFTKSKDSREYFKSAGSMPWWLIGVSMVAATTSTNSANLFTEIIRRDGLGGNWVWWAFLLTGMLTVFVYSKLWVRSGAATDIAFYELRYSGRPAAFLRGFRALYLGVIYNLVVMATVLLGAVKIGVVMFGVSAWTVLAVTAVASLVYSCLSGIRGTIYTDFFLFTVVMIGAVAVMYYGVSHPAVGGWSALMSNKEVVSKLSFFPDFSKTDLFIAVFVIPVAVQWWNVWYSGSEPGGGGYIVQRMLTARSPGHALGGTLFFNVINYALRPWPWYIAAFASIIIFPDLDAIRAAFPGVDPSLVGHDMAYPAMIKVVPNGWIGVVAASLMGALFSTIAAQLSMGANYVTNDIWKRFVRKDASDREMILVARASSVSLMVVSCMIATVIASAKDGFDLMVQIGAGTGIIFILRWFWMRINAWTEIVAMSVSFACAVFFQIAWPRMGGVQLLFWHKLLLTIAVTTVAWLAATFLTRPESPEVISRFRSLVRADGRDVGKGVLMTFLVSVGIFAFMAFVAWAVSSSAVQGAVR
jgi:Na+/proline symporter